MLGRATSTSRLIQVRHFSYRRMENLADRIVDCSVANNRHKYEALKEELNEESERFWKLCRDIDKEM